MRVCTGWTSGARWCRPSISSRRSSTTPSPTARSPRPTRCRDVYAMGGRPLTALAIAAFPQGRRRDRARDDLSRRPRTSCARPASRCSAATRCRTRKSSSAMRSPARSIRIGSGRTPVRRPGDRAGPDQALGTGVIATAIKFDRAPAAAADAAIDVDDDPEPGGGRGAVRRCRQASCTRAPTSPASAWSATPRRWRAPAAARRDRGGTCARAPRRAGSRWRQIRRAAAGRTRSTSRGYFEAVPAADRRSGAAPVRSADLGRAARRDRRLRAATLPSTRSAQRGVPAWTIGRAAARCRVCARVVDGSNREPRTLRTAEPANERTENLENLSRLMV